MNENDLELWRTVERILQSPLMAALVPLIVAITAYIKSCTAVRVATTTAQRQTRIRRNVRSIDSALRNSPNVDYPTGTIEEEPISVEMATIVVPDAESAAHPRAGQEEIPRDSLEQRNERR